jgi:hypothetical protein
MIEKGTAFHESIKVNAIDKKEYDVEVYPLSDADFAAVFEECGVDPTDLGNRNKLVANLKFLQKIAATATRDDNICTVLMPNESAKIMMKTFELSGLTASPKPDSTASSKASTPRNSKSS